MTPIALRLNHVLLADDGSAHARAARDAAVGLAASTGAKLTLLHVREPNADDATARARLADAIALASAAGVAHAIKIARPVGVTSPGRRIVAAAADGGADVIVVGARGSGRARLLLGSVSSYVVTNSTCSVFVVRTRAGKRD